jgi:hypothetical protein
MHRTGKGQGDNRWKLLSNIANNLIRNKIAVTMQRSKWCRLPMICWEMQTETLINSKCYKECAVILDPKGNDHSFLTKCVIGETKG